MGSDKRPKPRLRINFLKKEDRSSSQTTHDEILDSLTKQAHSNEKPITQVNDQVAMTEDSGHFQDQEFLKGGRSENKRSRHAGRSAFLLFIGGFVAIWSYGYLTGAYDIPYLSSLTRTPEFQTSAQTVSANLLPAGMLSAAALVAALFLHHRRVSRSPRN